MALAPPQTYPVVVAHASTSHRIRSATWKFVRTKPLGAAGAVLILVMALAAWHAPPSRSTAHAEPVWVHRMRGDDSWGARVLGRVLDSPRTW